MIIKILNKNKWFYYEIKSFNIDRTKALVKMPNKEFKDECGIDCTEIGEFTVVEVIDNKPNLSISYLVHEKLWDESKIIPKSNGETKYLESNEVDKPDEVRRWGVKLITMYLEEYKPWVVATPNWNENCFLLNNEGKTIERL